MKIIQILLFGFCCSIPNALATGFSETNGGFYIALSGSSTNEPIACGDPLSWRPFSIRSKDSAEFNYPDRSYGIKLTMLDAAGKEVPKTKLGAEFGIKFEQLRSFQDIVPTPRTGYSSVQIASILVQGAYDDTDAVSGPLLPAVNDLFQITKPGIYTLEIQMQMFLIHKDTNQWTRELIRFTPVSIKVQK
jgi:hypothetical protein